MSSAKTSGNDHQESVGELVAQASRQISRLARDELLLARVEMGEKGRRLGVGGGMLGGAGLLGMLTAQALVAGAIAALALVLPVWAAALVAAGVLAAAAAALVTAGRRRIARALPPVPEEALEGLKADISEIKERTTR
ncbi:phage holin family protein [Kitasatospora indigofera]|uniref:phage holin family protein n=1 Tax=Kitasatospora indigofera TaxID=67307 RepID=UPI0036BBE9D8